ncbi:MAG: hypothetical protein KatS3mg016_0676 [Fimbriimonadales bacterium]|nr:MAG: hypothetical protein KatS3mg016_0676 [Fimbriimonadales bacterium]
MEHSLLGLAHADSRKIRFAGYAEARLYTELRQAYQQANDAVGSILTAASGDTDFHFYQAMLRLELEWSQTRSRLAEYIAANQPQRISLTTLRTFSFRGHDTLDAALRDFKAVFQKQLEHEVTQSLQAMKGYAIGLLVALSLIVGLLWYRWARPLRWFQCALTQPHRESDTPPPLKGTEWEAIFQRVAFQERRLREVEVFMRDLAMGRIPEPLEPIDSTDSLARSSAWLIKRIEELRSERREAV